MTELSDLTNLEEGLRDLSKEQLGRNSVAWGHEAQCHYGQIVQPAPLALLNSGALKAKQNLTFARGSLVEVNDLKTLSL